MSEQNRLMPDPNKKYRLITRSDMDGLVCGVILKELGIIEDDILFVHPKDLQDKRIDVSQNDISTNLPYNENIFLCFDHHDSEKTRVEQQHDNHIIDPSAPSAARVVYNYFGGKDNPKLSNIHPNMLDAVDKADSAAFTKDDILNPEGWELLSFIMDSRTGLGRFRDFSISNYNLMMNLIDHCRQQKSISDILALPDVKERVDIYKEHEIKFREQIQRCSMVHKNVVVLDLRREETIWAGNRFVIYALFPQCNVSMHIMWGRNRQNTVLAVGKSILNKTSDTQVGNLMLEYGGGGHQAAGTCQVDNLKADEVRDEIISALKD